MFYTILLYFFSLQGQKKIPIFVHDPHNNKIYLIYFKQPDLYLRYIVIEDTEFNLRNGEMTTKKIYLCSR